MLFENILKYLRFTLNVDVLSKREIEELRKEGL